MLHHRTSLVIVTLALLLAACTSATTSAPETGELTATLAAPVPGLARVLTLELAQLESMPVQVNALVGGELPDTCTAVDAITQGLDAANNRLWVKITTLHQPGAACKATVTRYAESLPLDVYGLPAGTYTVDVNGVTGTFALTVDNVAPPVIGRAPVASVALQIAESFPVQIIAVVDGELPDGCTTINRITQSRDVDARRLRVDVSTARPEGMICTQALVAYEEHVQLEVLGLPAGTYTVDANGTVATFVLEQDNALPSDTSPTPTGAPVDGEVLGAVRLAGMDIRVSATLPIQAEVVAWGNLPDSCTTIGPINQRRDVTLRKLWVEIQLTRPAGAACTDTVTPFEQTIPLDLSDLPAGEYTVDVNGIPGMIILGTDNTAP